MNGHLVELLSAIGPGLCYALLALALLGLRQLCRGMAKTLENNAAAHERLGERLNDHEIRLARLEFEETRKGGCIHAKGD